jgi:methyl-accepting chemotaxis protein
MPTLRPSQESLRLVHVQHVAKRALAFPKGARFRTQDVVEGLHHVASTSSEYMWRASLLWSWWRAEWLTQEHDGAATFYRIRHEGRDAIERIASDPVTASFYVHSKRSTATQARPVEWFQPPELRVLDPAFEEESQQEEDTETEEPAEDDDEGSGDEAPDAVATAAIMAQLAQYLEQTSAALEQMAQRVGKLETETARVTAFISDYSSETMEALGSAVAVGPEVKQLAGNVTALNREVTEQSQLVLELATKLDGLGTKIDGTRTEVGVAVGEAISALSKRDGAQGMKVVLDRLDRHEQFHTQMAAEVTRMVERNKPPDEARIVAALKDALVPALEEAVMTAMAGVRAEVKKSMEKAIVDMTNPLVAACENLSKRVEVYDLKETIETVTSMRKGIEALASSIHDLSETHRIGDQHWSERASTIKDALLKALTDASNLLENVSAISSEIMSMAMDVTNDAGVPRGAMLERAYQVEKRRAAINDGIKAHSALGRGLISPTFTRPFGLPDGMSQPPHSVTVDLAPATAPSPEEVAQASDEEGT